MTSFLPMVLSCSVAACRLCYRLGRFSDAEKLFKLAAADGLNNFLTDVFIQRSTNLIEQAPANWDGVYTMTKK